MDNSDIINHLGEERHQYFNAIAPPIIQTSNFAFDSVADLKASFENERGHHLYTRGNNPTVTMLAQKIAALEGTEDCILLGSGAAAITNCVLPFVQSGDHIVAVENCYTWAKRLMDDFLPKFGVEVSYVDGTEFGNIEAALQQNTKMIFLESPTSLVFDLQDLEAVGRLAKARNILTVIDNSYCSPLGQRPHEFGIDLSFHSATKYIGGHSDVVAGVICGRKELINLIFEKGMMLFGNILGPMDAWLLMRGLRTLPIRIRQSGATTQQLVKFLGTKKIVKKIYYPFLESHEQYELGQRQMRFPMSLFSIEFDTENRDRVDAFCDRLRYFLLAVSWGGHESLAIPAEVIRKGSTHYIVRFYVGLEDFDLLKKDIEQALGVFDV